ncbi:MAG: phosphatidate cytidylyltransferase [Pseudomonadales bacterium]|nr:phosphatidate cytidylyltransferase [Pseudomonadales bacterium]
MRVGLGSVDSKLKSRILTGVVLAPLAVAAVFLLHNVPFAILFWVITALAMYEWAGMLVSEEGGANRVIPIAYLLLFALGAVPLYLLPSLQLPTIFLGLALWVAALLVLRFHGHGFNPFSSKPALAVTGLVFGWAGWLAITLIQALPSGHWWILYVFGICWGADIGAYFSGKRFGKTKLAPSISPGKTWEGVLGGLALAGLVCGLAVFAWQENRWLWLLITLVLIGLSVCGDLFESFVKRQTGVKDSGTLLPGHGGVLDRIDSILIVLPILALLLLQFRLGSL